MEFIPLDKWIDYSEKPLVIAGPCSAETESQVMQTARAIASIPNVKVFRSGIWKPRTRPGGFEGVGKEGLIWLKKVKDETGLLTTVEVAKPEHVALAVEAGIDILWIGARTVVNPFSVQELAEAMAGTDIPLLIKNPVNPDIKLWIGAIERFFKTGHHRIAAVHRGFSQIEKSGFRYPPIWEIPIELMRLMPGLPLICDPSHISGSAAMVRSVSQQALDLEMQGLMIETHIDPSHALTDARQQLTPSMLEEVLNSLIIRESGIPNDIERNLEILRHEIDKIDDQMLHLLAKRMEISEEMGKYKYNHNITILQIRRWKELFADRISKGEERNLNLDFLASLLRLVHEESIRIQTNVMKQSETGEAGSDQQD
ncbi:MAG TPA: chorismate mutase [Lentimicrobium sp.]|nr:chorismate mutase [Lentimicrobium sp.]